jgi:hypothetical protein
MRAVVPECVLSSQPIGARLQSGFFQNGILRFRHQNSLSKRFVTCLIFACLPYSQTFFTPIVDFPFPDSEVGGAIQTGSPIRLPGGKVGLLLGSNDAVVLDLGTGGFATFPMDYRSQYSATPLNSTAIIGVCRNDSVSPQQKHAICLWDFSDPSHPTQSLMVLLPVGAVEGYSAQSRFRVGENFYALLQTNEPPYTVSLISFNLSSQSIVDLSPSGPSVLLDGLAPDLAAKFSESTIRIFGGQLLSDGTSIYFKLIISQPVGGFWICRYHLPTKRYRIITQISESDNYNGLVGWTIVRNQTLVAQFSDAFGSRPSKWVSIDLQSLAITQLPIDDIVDQECNLLNGGHAAILAGRRFIYLTDGTPSGTIAVSLGTLYESEFSAADIDVAERAAIYSTGSGTVNLLDFTRCSPSGGCPTGEMCVGGLCAIPFSTFTCKGQPPRRGAICSLGSWFLPGGWFINGANQTSVVDPTVIEGDLRFLRGNISLSGANISIDSINSSLSVSGCVDFGDATLTIVNATFYDAIPESGKAVVDIISFGSFCNNRSVRALHHSLLNFC